MKTIKKNVTNEIIINKSRFITKLIKINNEEEVREKLALLKREYKDATHYCYAYITGNIKRFNDDGEPSGTAGMPILNVLENNNLTNILGVVIRYFGGIKLGAGGLVRAYTKAITECLNHIEIVNLTSGINFKIEFTYDFVKKIDNILKNQKITYKEYDNNIIYECSLTKDNFQKLKKELETNSLTLEIIDETLVEID
ncbi:MAG: YigZ family protein [Bacilli bacterium]|nr:YigZ family protein [Bacilli bacterium]